MSAGQPAKIRPVNLPHIKPLELARRVEPFDHRDFIFELKHDGFRCIAYVSDGKCDLVSRRDNQYESFDGLREAIASELRVKNAILDGEIVCLDGFGRSQFQLLFRRGEPVFYAFDLLWLNGRDLRQRSSNGRFAETNHLHERSAQSSAANPQSSNLSRWLHWVSKSAIENVPKYCHTKDS